MVFFSFKEWRHHVEKWVETFQLRISHANAGEKGRKTFISAQSKVELKLVATRKPTLCEININKNNN